MDRKSNRIETFRKLTLAGAVALAASMPLSFAHAAGGDSGGSSGGSDSSGAQACNKGWVWSKEKKRCVRQTAETSDDDLTSYAYTLAKADRYEEALEMLNLLRDPNTPKALNYRGYVTRHLGRVDEGITYYLQSVSLDPNYAQVREYLGEAYVIKGRIDLAQEQLEAIKAICGNTECEEYEDLAEAIENPTSL